MTSSVLFLAITVVFTAGCRTDEIPVNQVKVWDETFQVIRIITDPSTLAALKSIWEDRAIVSERPTFTHKVDLATSDESVRWLYHPDGFATVLGVKESIPIYRVREAEKLKEILIPQQPPAGDVLKAALGE